MLSGEFAAMGDAVKLTPDQIRAIEKALSSGERVEILTTKEGIKIFTLRRKQIAAS